jgi:glutamyl-tRNA reductase
MKNLKVIAFTHKTVSIDEIGKYHCADERLQECLTSLKQVMNISELMYLSTCNRVEFIVSTNDEIDSAYLYKFLHAFNAAWDEEFLNNSVEKAIVYSGDDAIRHLFHVATSIDSLVVGEREIITQVRNAYEKCRQFSITGDLIRLAIKKTIETAKKIYTETNIARNPVSVVSLAYRKLRELNVPLNARILIIGAGVTNTAMAKYLKKHGFVNFTIFNRTLANAEKLAKEINGIAFQLSELKNYRKGFDVIVTCTGSEEPIITLDLYRSLVGDDKQRKIVIDLAVPNDLDVEILNNYDVNLIAVNNLQEIAQENLKERQKEIDNCNLIIENKIDEFKEMVKERQLELALSAVPEKVKEIKAKAINSVFAKDLESLDNNSREVLEKVLAYMEKKYISVPMKMAKEILLEKTSR